MPSQLRKQRIATRCATARPTHLVVANRQGHSSQRRTTGCRGADQHNPRHLSTGVVGVRQLRHRIWAKDAQAIVPAKAPCPVMLKTAGGASAAAWGYLAGQGLSSAARTSRLGG